MLRRHPFAVLGRHFIEVIKLRVYVVAAYVAAAVALLFAFIFALGALRQWMFAHGFAYPDIWIAVAFIVLAAIAVAVAAWLQRREPETRPAVDLAFLAGPPAAKFAVKRIRPRTVAVGVVLLAGLMLGRRLARGPADD